MKNKEQIVKQMKTEILQDMAEGLVPTTVKAFSELHDYRDANCYGGFCDDEFADALIEHFGGRDEHEGMPQGMLDLINECQNEIDIWLRLNTAIKINVKELAEEALNAACKLMQDRLGVTDGGFASAFFSDDQVQDVFVEYINAEVELMSGLRLHCPGPCRHEL